MISQSTATSRSQSRRQPVARLQLLIVCDSAERLLKLRSSLESSGVEITGVSSLQELDQACLREHDLAIVDVQTAQIRPVLKILRASALHSGISLLVDASRVNDEDDMAGVFPEYRAMPCSISELLTLAQQQINPTNGQRIERLLL